jgi:hypothetical protein
MKKQWTVASCLFLLFLAPSFATTYYVAANGNDSDPALSGDGIISKTSSFQGIVVY